MADPTAPPGDNEARSHSSECPHDEGLAAFAEGRVAEDERERIAAHLDGCVRCRAVIGDLSRLFGPETSAIPSHLAALTAATQDRLAPGARVGRYVVLGIAGEGAMGVVYTAYDPELDRRIALKLLRSSGQADANRATLSREARALAKLAHPHVIAAYDVGAFGDGLFLAMEFVDGATLREWLKVATRDARAILRAFVDAGRGLAAAHAEGLVHRDFKPDNVLVGADGRVRVTDFGLARIETVAVALEGAVSGKGSPVTQTAWGGTPRYMAPEQRRGLVDARSDQFSFAIALFEALYGCHPFGVSATEIEGRSASGHLAEVDRTRAPARVHAALRTALSFKPEDRFPSMDALLLAIDPVPRRRAWGWFAGTGALIAIAGTAAVASRSRSTVCRDADAPVRAVWNDEARAALARAFASTTSPFAAAALEATTQQLTAYATRWSGARADACVATRVRGEQSDENLTLRMECLDRRLADVAALTKILSSGDPTVLERAPLAVAELPSIAVCDDVATLRAPVRPPEEAEARRLVTALATELREAEALALAGQHADALQRLDPMAARVSSLGYRPLEAEILALRARSESEVGRRKEARETLLAGIDAAERGKHDALLAELWAELSMLLATHLGEHDEARRAERHARAMLDRLHDPPPLVPVVLDRIGAAIHAQGRSREAVPILEESVRRGELAYGPDSLKVAAIRRRLGFVLKATGDDAHALAVLTRSLETTEHALGPHHPAVADVENSIGAVHEKFGRLDAALAAHERALAIREAAYGPDNVRVAESLTNISIIYGLVGRLDDAVHAAERAYALYERLSPESSSFANTANNAGNAYEARGNLERARYYFTRACELNEKLRGLGHPSLGVSLGNLGLVELRSAHPREALALFVRARAILEKARGPDSVDVAPWLTAAGRAQIALGHPDAAIADLERALAIRTSQSVAPSKLADTRFALGRALAESKRDPARGGSLVREARDGYARSGPGSRRELEEVTSWLRKKAP